MRFPIYLNRRIPNQYANMSQIRVYFVIFMKHRYFYVPLQLDIKKPDSSPVTESWERNARDCNAKVQKIWNITRIFLKLPPL